MYSCCFVSVGLMTEIDVLLGKSIARCRQKVGFTQEDLAQRLHVSKHTVMAFEEGRRRASASQLYEIAGYLDVTVEGFFEWLDTPVPIPAPAAPEASFGPEGHDLAGHYAALSQSDRAAIFAFLLASGGN